MISRRTQIVLLALLVVSTVLLTGFWKSVSIPPSAPRSTASAEPSEASSRARALTVLRSWDERRAMAYAAGDANALTKLYVPGSDSGANDRRVLQRYLARGLRVHQMRTQILDLEIRAHDEESMSLLVTDRLSDAIAVGSGVRVRLPRDQATTREIDLRRDGVQWLVADATPVDQPAAGRSSAEESTSTTPVSRKP